MATKGLEAMLETCADAVRAILEAPAAWVEAGAIDAAQLELLMVDGLVELWRLPGGDAVTLTPIGAARLGVCILERWEWGKDPETGQSVQYEQPVWTEAGDPRLDRSVRLPRRPGEVPMGRPEDVEDPHDDDDGPELLTDEVSGRVVELFAAAPQGWDHDTWVEHLATWTERWNAPRPTVPTRGFTVRIDRRMAKGPRGPHKKPRKRRKTKPKPARPARRPNIDLQRLRAVLEARAAGH